MKEIVILSLSVGIVSVIVTGLTVFILKQSTDNLLDLVRNVLENDGEEGAREESQKRYGLDPEQVIHLQRVFVMDIITDGAVVEIDEQGEKAFNPMEEELVDRAVFSDGGVNDSDPWMVAVFDTEEYGLIGTRFRFGRTEVPAHCAAQFEEVDTGDMVVRPTADISEELGGDPEDSEIAEYIEQAWPELYEEHYDTGEGEKDGEDADSE